MSRRRVSIPRPVHIGMVLVGNIIGAGFASGAEMRTYFTKYGAAGFLGMIAAAFILTAAAWGFLELAREYDLRSFEEAVAIFAGEKAGAVFDTVGTAFMLISLGVMMAGCGEVCRQQGILSYPAGAILMGLFTWAAMCLGRGGLVAVNLILGPFLILGIFLLALTAAEDRLSVASLLPAPLTLTGRSESFPWLPALGSGILYASYNMISAAVVLTGLGHELQSRREARLAALFGGGLVGGLILAAGLATFLNYDTIEAVPIPALALLSAHPYRQTAYMAVLIGAMYTTAVSDAFGLSGRMARHCPWPRWIVNLLIVAGAYGIAGIGFGRLVEQGYPLFGAVGLGQLILLLFHYIKKKQEKQAIHNGRH